MRRFSEYLKIFLYSFISYFSALLIIFLLNLDIKFRSISNDDRQQHSSTLVNYYTIFDLYQAKIPHIGNYTYKHVFTSFQTPNSLYLSKIDLYGNLINSNLIRLKNINFQGIAFDQKKMYSRAVIKSDQKLYSLKLDYNINLLECHEIEFNQNYRQELIYLNPENLGVLLENDKNKKHILFFSFEPNKKDFEFLFKQNVVKIGFEEKFVILNLISEGNDLPLLIDTSSYKQYVINPYSYVTSFSSNTEYLFLILKKYDNSKHLLKISKENRRLEKMFHIQGGEFINLKISNYQNYAILDFNHQDSIYVVFISPEGKTEKVIKLTNIPVEYNLYTCYYGIFLTFSYKNLPFLIRFDSRAENYNTAYFSLNNVSELPISIVESQGFSISQINYLIRSNEVEAFLKKIELEVKKEEILLRYYSTF
ncbi:MAG: hypothetical protein RMJ51_00840 [Candidatus Calescibacterium sp.]|nr:hypothetical protein [Candidatus Calescibacterium sp.]MCX7972624.1 hypothetical protein [bacterium]MDW8194779.1 hypothetical protein [Candidatus Calescibacterium sp.]